jgi:hypothetical protein
VAPRPGVRSRSGDDPPEAHLSAQSVLRPK